MCLCSRCNRCNRCSRCSNNIGLPARWQSCPANPSRQIHSYFPGWSTHVPPFKHGLDWHSSKSTSQYRPKRTATHGITVAIRFSCSIMRAMKGHERSYGSRLSLIVQSALVNLNWTTIFHKPFLKKNLVKHEWLVRRRCEAIYAKHAKYTHARTHTKCIAH